MNENLIQLEHDLAVATGEGWTDKLVWMATNDIPWLLTYIRSIEKAKQDAYQEGYDAGANAAANDILNP